MSTAVNTQRIINLESKVDRLEAQLEEVKKTVWKAVPVNSAITAVIVFAVLQLAGKA